MQTMITAGLGTNSFTYTDAGNPASEYGLWPNDAVSWTYHASAPRLRAGLTLQQPSGSWTQSYSYDAAQRLQTLSSPAGTFTYTYRGPGTVWTNLALPNSAAITNLFDTAARLTRTALRNSSGTILNSHDYLHNGAGQRQRQTLTDGSYTTYGYDDDAQLESSLGFLYGGTPVADEQLDFEYDPGWNMTNRTANSTSAAYTVNDLNQVTSDGVNAYTYDENGNRTSKGGAIFYTWDDENRLTEIADLASHTFRSTFTYDGLALPSQFRRRLVVEWA